MHVESIQLFCDIARHRSVSKGAAMHGVTQSAASQRIKELERRMDTTLIDRSVRPLGLTQAGEIYYEGCCDLLKRHRRLRGRLSSLRIEGRIRVDAIYSAGIGLLENLRKRFETKHPNVHVSIEYKRPERVHEAVRQQQCDLGICSYPGRWQGVEGQLLRDEPMVLVCASGHALAGEDRVSADQLTGQAMVGFEPGLPVERHIGRYMKDHGIAVDVTTVFDNIDTILEAVSETNCIAIVPERTARRHIEAGQVVAVGLDPPLSRPLGVIYRRRGRIGGTASLPSVVQAFIDFLIKHAETESSAMVSGAADGGGG
jgi:DNA-binding transcriptional LysR family regulator